MRRIIYKLRESVMDEASAINLSENSDKCNSCYYEPVRYRGRRGSLQPMTDAPTPTRAKRTPRIGPPPVAPDTLPDSWSRINNRIIQAVIDGDVAQVVERWEATTLAELRAAIDDAIEIANEAGIANLALKPVDVRLMRSLGKCGTLKVSIARPSSGVGKAR